LVKCIDAGLNVSSAARRKVQKQLADVHLVAATLDPKNGSPSKRKRAFVRLQKQFAKSKKASQQRLSEQMKSWLPGLFVGGRLRTMPWDNLDLERFFRLPKGHERHIHGRKHVGMRTVREGATLLPTLDAHQQHEGQFTAEELLPYRNHPAPIDQQKAQHRHQVMRRAASTKQRPKLLQELKKRCLDDEKQPDLKDR
jgi:hypothetical protein